MAIVNGFKYFSLFSALNGATIKCMLLTSTHVTNIDTQEFIDDVSANEASGTNYTAGGATLANVAITKDDTDNEGIFDADDTVFTNVTIADFAYYCLYIDTGTPATSRIITIVPWAGGTQSATAENVTLTWVTEGIFNQN